jgi:hypothetical protein
MADRRRTSDRVVEPLDVIEHIRSGLIPGTTDFTKTMPGFEAAGFYGISVPKGAPPPIVAVLNQVVGEALKDPKWAARLTEIGGIAKPMAPRAEFGRLVADETEKWRKVVEFAGVPAERQGPPTRHCGIAGQPVRGVGTVACRASGKAGGACSSMVRAGRS